MVLKAKNLHDGTKMPPIGLGLWKIKDEQKFHETFEAAVAVGYRHFDSAQAYGNEQFLGDAWRKSGLKREELFITTKIMVQNFGYQKTLDSFDASFKKLQTDYVDLLLLHFPGLPWQRKDSWKALEEIKQSGRVKSIGVSNYKVKHLEAMKGYANEMPVVNQAETHVFFQQEELREYCASRNIQLQAYSPLAHGHDTGNKVIKRIAEKHGKSYAQIMIRWCLEVGAVPLPKTTSELRLAENFEALNFSLDSDDMAEIEKLDRNMRTVWRSIFLG